jgi:bifunctional non-homologous end joining protein LigD
MGLAQYRRKRDFTRTPEPAGVVRRKGKKQLAFVVQKHAATRLHYDFRLEMEGVLKSWAVPKGPSLKPGEKRLAVQVEDHPLDYGEFEGTIPEGEYGGGTVMLWDRGHYTCDEDPLRLLERGSIRFDLFGEKLRGEFSLVQMKGEAGGNGKNWLLIKGRDDSADERTDILKSKPLSVLSGREMGEIASGGNPWLSDRKKGGRAAARARTKSAAKSKSKFKSRTRSKFSRAKSLPGARLHSLPRSIHPELATLVSEAPAGNEWIHEIKFDGYRILARMENGKVRLYSRNGLDWTERFDPIRAAVEELPAENLILDGEVVAHDAGGTASFEAMQRFLREGRRAGLVYYVFDVLHLDGYDVTGAPLIARKELLAELLGSNGSQKGFLRFSQHHEGDGAEIFEQACQHHLEGIISKKRDSAYRPGRGRDWVKTKCANRQELVIGGYTDPEGARSGFGALLLGVYESPGRLKYAGRVGTGFNDELLSDLLRRMKKLEQKESPFVNPPTSAARRRGVHWIKPQLVAEVEFTEWTRDGLLRHPSFQGLREDKKAAEVVREKKAAAQARRRSSPRR